MSYSEKVIDHFENPRNAGSLDKNDPSVGTGLVGAPACGDVMKLQLKINEEGIIEDAKFKTFGCGSAIASSSLITTLVKGRHVKEAEKITNAEIAKDLSLPPVKIHCSVLAEDAIKAAIKDFNEKNTIPKKEQACEACGCDPCDCGWGINNKRIIHEVDNKCLSSN
jgi:nitrogen fixation NifU-like protein